MVLTYFVVCFSDLTIGTLFISAFTDLLPSLQRQNVAWNVYVIIYSAVLLFMDMWVFHFAAIINDATVNSLRRITLLTWGTIFGDRFLEVEFQDQIVETFFYLSKYGHISFLKNCSRYQQNIIFTVFVFLYLHNTVLFKIFLPI